MKKQISLLLVAVALNLSNGAQAASLSSTRRALNTLFRQAGQAVSQSKSGLSQDVINAVRNYGTQSRAGLFNNAVRNYVTQSGAGLLNYAKQPMEELAMTTIKRPYTQASSWWPFSLSAILPFLSQKDEEAAENDRQRLIDEMFESTPDSNRDKQNKGIEAIKAGANPNALSGHCGETLLMIAALKGNLEALHALIKAGADLNAKDNHGQTPLMYAINGRHLEALHALIKAGADLNAKDNDGYTPLHIAEMYLDSPIFIALIKAGPDLNAKNKYGQTPLMTAVVRGHSTKHINVLIEAGADLNAKDNDGETPLMKAAMGGRLDVVKKLIQAGADVNAKDNDGQTPLMKAARKGRLDVVDALKQAGAQK